MRRTEGYPAQVQSKELPKVDSGPVAGGQSIRDNLNIGWRVNVEDNRIVLTKWGNPGPDRRWVRSFQDEDTVGDLPKILAFREIGYEEPHELRPGTPNWICTGCSWESVGGGVSLSQAIAQWKADPCHFDKEDLA